MPIPTIAVAIPTFLREEVLIDTIKEVLQQTPQAHELLVIDQTPQHKPETEKQLKDWNDNGKIRWLKHSPPNLPGARNRAAQETSCEVILFIDDDVKLCAGFVGMHQGCYTDLHTHAVHGKVFNFLNELEQTEPLPVLKNWACLIGCNFSIRLNTYIACHGFDENLGVHAYYEENDFAQRLLSKGYQIVFNPNASLLHLKVAEGGCRIPGNRAAPEWNKSLSFLVYGFRHGPLPKLLKEALRAGPLRKENAFRPWRWPWAWLNFIYSLDKAWSISRRAIKSPFSEGEPSS